jgi:DNA repair protein RecN (Recombination protein N)
MLAELRVRQLGVIDDLTLELSPGVTALTGETGAGKTLVVQALQLILGQRADTGLVRAGAPEALVEARFFDEEGVETVVARSIPADGRSRCWIDGRMVPLGALSELAPQLADIHGQGDHQALLHTQAQRGALDHFGSIDSSPVVELQAELDDLRRNLEGLGGNEHERARQADVLRHQITEIENADLSDPDEDSALAAEQERLANLTTLKEHAARALGALDAEASDRGALDLLGVATSALEGLGPLGTLAARLRGAQAELADAASELRSILETWEDDPERLAGVVARRHLLTNLYRKYGGDRTETLNFAREAQDAFAALSGVEERAAALQLELRSVEAKLSAAEGVLLAVRRAAAPKLAAAIETRLADLAMAGSRFTVEVDDAAGGDQVTFGLGANAGEPIRPLARVASGGELARTMLALRLVSLGGPGTMVFDEVDAGVGGAAALALAAALAEVGVQRQVLVVTHLAQVAAFATHHVAVIKGEVGGRTTTQSVSLEGSERVVEVSRMLSGHPDSERAQAHARELLELGLHAQNDRSPSAPNRGRTRGSNIAARAVD